MPGPGCSRLVSQGQWRVLQCRTVGLGKACVRLRHEGFESLVLHWRKAGPDSGEAALLRGTLTVFDTVLMVVRVLD
jgi:hypothetical protein